ncbi:unnamed protein product [Acanthoscelides obtectus]|uniref:Uncharacterized protein n=1 Tax=Acanthoscelides obtectus TaxID=200917 RepID=A0A9P0MGW7_ACAOB|nr:unnamed protein product [Acanthoscelides obtectus]CAK1641440.1 hypothetical protein AOBTE_LOCUS12406 [Acanthoscelides obtectus]
MWHYLRTVCPNICKVPSIHLHTCVDVPSFKQNSETSNFVVCCLFANMDIETAAAAFLVISSAYLLLKKKKKRKSRRWWTVSLIRSRERYSGNNLLADLLKEPSGFFENFCRMSSEDFKILLNMVESYIVKKNTKWRKAIPANERLAITLRFLATGDSFKSLCYLFKVSSQLILSIVPEVCMAIIKVLGGTIKMPTSQEGWRSISNDFERLWNFPSLCGRLRRKAHNYTVSY